MKISNDVFDISARLKEIDPSYEVEYDFRTGKFELYGGRERRERLIVFPFEALDQRALEHARKTRRERMDRLMREIDEENERTERDAIYKAKMEAEKRLDESAKKYL
jgi:hypothetical protein